MLFILGVHKRNKKRVNIFLNVSHLMDAFADNIVEFNQTFLVDGVNTTGYTVHGVVPGRTYYISVSANNSVWEGPRTDPVSITPYQVPTPPFNLTGRIGDGLVNLSWQGPLFLGGDKNVTFAIYMQEGNGTLSYLRWLNSNQTIVRGLTNGVDYRFAIRARNIIARADVIIYADSLINPEVCSYARREAEVYPSASLSLEEITVIIVNAVRQGRVVARLQSGDPSIYGAIQEQMVVLDEKGIEYEIIP